MAAPTITSSLDGRYMSALKPERLAAAKVCSEWTDRGCACINVRRLGDYMRR